MTRCCKDGKGVLCVQAYVCVCRCFIDQEGTSLFENHFQHVNAGSSCEPTIEEFA